MWYNVCIYCMYVAMCTFTKNRISFYINIPSIPNCLKRCTMKHTPVRKQYWWFGYNSKSERQNNFSSIHKTYRKSIEWWVHSIQKNCDCQAWQIFRDGWFRMLVARATDCGRRWWPKKFKNYYERCMYKIRFSWSNFQGFVFGLIHK